MGLSTKCEPKLPVSHVNTHWRASIWEDTPHNQVNRMTWPSDFAQLLSMVSLLLAQSP